MEKGIINILAQCPDCLSSSNWLGKFAYNPTVRDFGLWNSEHVEIPDPMTQHELERFEELVLSV